MTKPNITNISSVAIIYKQTDPSRVCVDIKDAGIPITLMAGKICPIGGNWIGKAALNDQGPLSTLQRELGEEFSFARPIRSSEEYAQLGLADIQTFMPTPQHDVEVTDDDIVCLDELKRLMQNGCQPIGSYANTVTKAAMDSANPANTRDAFTTLACYYGVPLDDDPWNALEALWRRYGNLSNESVTAILSLNEMLERQIGFAFAHDAAFRAFFTLMGLPDGAGLRSIEGMNSENAGPILETYAEYADRYDILKKPS